MTDAKRTYRFIFAGSSRLAEPANRQHKARLGLWLVLALFGFGFVPASAQAREAPSVAVQSNAPGWVTVIWEHSGKGISHYLVQRQQPAYTWVFKTHVGSHTDMGLQAGATYNYRVCAVDADGKETCSPWIKVTTMAPESSGGLAIPTITSREAFPDRIRLSWSSATKYGSFNVRYSEKGARAIQVNVKGSVTYGAYEARNLLPGRTYVFGVQGCNWGLLGSSCSGWRTIEVNTPLPPPPPPSAPVISTSAATERRIILTWQTNAAERITRTVVERDGRLHDERAAATGRLDDTVRPNTVYTYRVCVTNETGTACSDVVTAMAKPVAPSPLANVTFTPSRFSGAPGGGLSREAARIKTVIRATWRNTDTPGQFITLEREDRLPLDRIRVGPSWVEVKQISAKNDPTEIATEIKLGGVEIGTRQGNSYRVCAVVPALGKAGKVCSTPFTMP